MDRFVFLHTWHLCRLNFLIAAEIGTLKIMPLGDSLTQCQTLAYRCFYTGCLTNPTCISTLCGGRRDERNEQIYDTDHSGFFGYTEAPGASLLDMEKAWRQGTILYHLDRGYCILSSEPDVILLMIGINDLNKNKGKMKQILWIYFCSLPLFLSCSGIAVKGKTIQERDPLLQPFSEKSIWNMPIGANAVYVHAHIEPALEAGMTVDEDYIVMTPDQPLVGIYENKAGWDREKDRCKKEGGVLFSAPIPTSFIVDRNTWDGVTPNAGLAVLMSDKRTVKQTQPFAKCEVSEATSHYVFEDTDLYGDGLYGAHGGSGLSALGGAIRTHELTPTSGPIRHALKVNLFGRKNIYYDELTKGFRWPARTADAYAAGNYYTDRSDKVAPACRMGALLAIPAMMDIEDLRLETEPARIIAQALQDYGAYLVDDTGWDVYAFVTEWSPEARFTEVFAKNWGFSFAENSPDTPWTRDMAKIFSHLHVVDNNSATTIGGGGQPRVSLCAPLTPYSK